MPHSVKEAAEILGVHSDTVRNAIRDGRLPARIKGKGKRKTHFVIEEQALEEYKQRTAYVPTRTR